MAGGQDGKLGAPRQWQLVQRNIAMLQVASWDGDAVGPSAIRIVPISAEKPTSSAPTRGARRPENHP